MTKQPSGWTDFPPDDVSRPANLPLLESGPDRWPDRVDPRGAALDNKFLRDRMSALVRELNELRPPESRIMQIAVLIGASDHFEITVMDDVDDDDVNLLNDWASK